MLGRIAKAARTLFGFGTPNTDALAQWQDRYAKLRATYDAARTTREFENYWANADRFDADSANSREVRHTLISRSRYETGSNGYADGIASTAATDLVGIGPTLRMQTGSEGFNRMVELRWFLWCEAIQFGRKLWCMAHAKHQDGEGFAVIRRNPNVRHEIKLNLCLYEAEQFQTPSWLALEDGQIDGIEFDQFGNPTFYELLRRHPGSSSGVMSLTMETERLPAAAVLHWFKMRRPGQHRGIPECSSTLNVGAAARRWREATIAAAETAADFSAVLESELPPDTETAPVIPFDTTDIDKRLMVALPYGTKLNQFKAEQPTATYEAFSKSLINEQARPKSMPYNKAACDSSSYNYASGRLDHQTYYAALDVERADANALVLDPLFNAWFDIAIARYRWLGGDPFAVSAAARVHVWDWPTHRVADVKVEAQANEIRLHTGQVSLPALQSERGKDPEDEAIAEAAYFGITVEELKRRQLDAIYPPTAQPAKAEEPEEPEALAILSPRRKSLNGHANGVHVNGN